MPDRRRFAVLATPLLALLGVAAAILLPSGAAPAAAQSTGPAVTCFEISVGWRICVAPSQPAQPPGSALTGAAVPDAANNPGLVADCTILLAVKDYAARHGGAQLERRHMPSRPGTGSPWRDAAARDGVATCDGARADGHDPGRAWANLSRVAVVAPGCATCSVGRSRPHWATSRSCAPVCYLLPGTG